MVNKGLSHGRRSFDAIKPFASAAPPGGARDPWVDRKAEAGIDDLKICLYLFADGSRAPSPRLYGRPACGVARGRGDDAAAALGVMHARRADGQRAGADPRAEPAARVAALETLVRGGVGRPVPRGKLGVLSRQRRSGGERAGPASRGSLRRE